MENVKLFSPAWVAFPRFLRGAILGTSHRGGEEAVAMVQEADGIEALEYLQVPASVYGAVGAT